MNRLHARLAGRARPAGGIVSQPEPRSIGRAARGRQLLAGNILCAGHLVEIAAGAHPWDIVPPDAAFAAELHGFGWLDDLAAVPDPAAGVAAQAWVDAWVARHGRGRGPGWDPDIAGRRLIRLLHHAVLLMHARPTGATRALMRTMAAHAVFLAKRWPAATPGLPRIEALTGLLYGAVGLMGMEAHVAPAVAALERACADTVDAGGAIATRNPEELLEVFTLLTWAAAMLAEAGRPVGAGVLGAIERIAPVLRALRHADGGLARFHGGGRGLPGRLDRALASAAVPARPPEALAMGYARLHAGRTSVIVDATPPPARAASHAAHASTLAFELTSGRRPVIVNCGPGRGHGADWRLAARATACHSTLSIEGASSARIAPGGGLLRPAAGLLIEAPVTVTPQLTAREDGMHLLAGHDGYAARFGLTHMRRLHLSATGRALSGEDTLGAMDEVERRAFDRALDRSRLRGVRFAVRFHLHPDVEPALDMGGAAVSLVLRSGEVWVFRHEGGAEMTLERSVYLQSDRLHPRQSRQIVLASSVVDYAAQVTWTLAKAQETPDYLRDTEADDLIGQI